MTRGLRRFHESQQSHFLTFSCYHRKPNFNSAKAREFFLECLEQMRRHFTMCIYGYVIMPEHIHLLVSEPAQKTLADAMHYLKLSFAKRLKSEPMMLNPTVPQVRARPLGANLGEECEGSAVLQSRPVPQVRGRSLAPNLGPPNPQSPTPFWQPRYYDRNIRDEEEFRVKLRYLHRNPVKRGLVKTPTDWKWSSFRHYALREKGSVEIESQWTAADREANSHDGLARIFLIPG